MMTMRDAAVRMLVRLKGLRKAPGAASAKASIMIASAPTSQASLMAAFNRTARGRPASVETGSTPVVGEVLMR
jgi:hypothetical protein